MFCWKKVCIWVLIYSQLLCRGIYVNYRLIISWVLFQDDEDEEDDDANDDSDEDEEDKLPVTGRLEKPTSTAKSPLMYNFDLFEDADAQVLDESDEEESDADTDEQKD